MSREELLKMMIEKFDVHAVRKTWIKTKEVKIFYINNGKWTLKQGK